MVGRLSNVSGSKSTRALGSISRSLDYPKGDRTFTGRWHDQMSLLGAQLCQPMKIWWEEVGINVENEVGGGFNNPEVRRC